MGGRRPTLIYPVLVFLVVGGVYGIYLFLHLVPQLQQLQWLTGPASATKTTLPPDDPHMHVAPAAEVIGLAAAFHLTFALFVLAFFQAMMTPPGSVPSGDVRWERGKFNIDEKEDQQVENIIRDTTTDLTQPHIRALLKRMPVVERKRIRQQEDEESPLTVDPDERKRKCHGCMVYKPDRVHHCQACNQCVLRMDHHCPWIANCVGFRNYKHFLLVLFYGVLSLAFLLIAMRIRFSHVFSPILDMNYFLRRDLPIACAFIVCALLFLVLASFFTFHVYLTTHAMSTIEYREKARSSDKDVKHAWAVAHVKYDQGSMYQNVKHVLGEPWMWLFPVDPRPEDDGTYANVDGVGKQL